MNYKSLDRRIKRHIIAGDNAIFMAIQPGLEEAGEMELKRMGLPAVREPEPGSLTTTAGLEELWRLVLTGRSFSRIYLRLKEFKAQGFRELKSRLESIPWELYLRERCEYSVKVSTARSRLHVHEKIIKSLNHSLAEHFRALEAQPPVFTEEATGEAETQRIIIRAVEDRFTVSLDAGGGALNERGYRQHINEAPLKENTASALLILAGIHGTGRLIDPMCGSGTFSLEAMGISAGGITAPEKSYPFEYWPSFRPNRYDWLVRTIREQQNNPLQVTATDIDPKSLDAARKNLEHFAEQSGIRIENMSIHREDFFKNGAPEGSVGEETLVILNPPYGRRLPVQDQMDFFRKTGTVIKETYKGCRWGIIAPGLECEKALGLHWDRKFLFKNGGFPVSFITGRS
ncbi:MAG: hypothetical protein PQJ58_22210 [Spirochaetales bacterium]|nr:hypothetical protein [Spirochaetales bacterium]